MAFNKMAYSNQVSLILLDSAAVGLVREWGKISDEKRNDLHSAQNIRVIRSEQKMGGGCSTYGWTGDVQTGLGGET